MVRALMGLPTPLPEGSFQHLHWKVSVDVATRRLHATATYTVLQTPSSTDEGCLALAVEGLSIESVAVNNDATEFKVIEMSPTSDQLHSTLAIAVPKQVVAPYSVAVTYHLAKPSLACHWLDSSWLITQSYPSYAPSLLPVPPQLCMKFTYTAHVTTSALATVLMSASLTESIQVPKSKSQVVTFNQPVAVPSHLLALVICPATTTLITTQHVASACTVHAASIPSSTSNALALVPDLVAAAERTTGLPWVWPPLHVLVVPTALTLSFRSMATPSLVVVDEAAAQKIDILADSVVRHWTAFRAPHETWTDVWLSEGWAKWLQLEVLNTVHPPSVAPIVHDGLVALRRALELDADTALVASHHSSHQWSVVGREKGYLFLRNLQTIVGDEAFQYFASAFVSGFEQGSVTTDEFCAFCHEYFTLVEDLPPLPVAWDSWLHVPGYIPSDSELKGLVGHVVPSPLPVSLLVDDTQSQQSLDVPGLLGISDTLELCSAFEHIQRQHGAVVALDVWLQCSEAHSFHPVTVHRIESLVHTYILQLLYVQFFHRR
ncbi:hypothetical protein, variant [Aphanomyces astaci]|uniref:Peptidase M1 membrane alanine aminopeptidase domain-containing protein n=1 Tax=Aphanomyces astaci TaxID=112090 RepID=W4G9J4_APHAT|nr:hypothetical protein, variant [Aphanomyces astaci]ETV75956.1 hypothetical protein, variant [Aphanomyces astaci]|eukprot:XP_009834597.1 hypothetical protein, variant [Aphanomyces astaci]